MKITHITQLNEQLNQELRFLVDQCCKAEDLRLSFPEEGEEFWILEEYERTAAFFSVCRSDDSLWECSAFTRPDCRKKGYFSALLDEVCRYGEQHGDPEFCFAADGRCPSALSLLKEMEAQLFQEEYMMEHPLTAFTGLTPEDAASLPSKTLSILSSMKRGMEYLCFIKSQGSFDLSLLSLEEEPSLCLSSAPGEPAVSCRLMAQGNAVYLYSLYTLPGLRRQGLAYRFFLSLIPCLAASGFKQLRLQVSGSNEPAMKLYEKTGFHITETLSFYLY